ncbi:MAG: DNA-processing protein DprA [Bacillota bacterium]
MQFEESFYLTLLNGVSGFGPKTLVSILDQGIKPSSLWNMNSRQMKDAGIKGKKKRNLIEYRKKVDLNKILSKFRNKNFNFITILDNDYPAKLKQIYDPPPVLFYKGENLFEQPSAAVVGSRNSTVYGRKITYNIAKKLADKNINIISGMAKGIDSTAHRGALKSEFKKTTAVLGSGFEYIYPSENKMLAKKIEKNGMLISEFNPNISPVPGNFPRRNRIISGLADIVLVMEAGKKSGSLITVNYALEQGKDVMALPGNIDRPTSKGTNNLIKDGAAIITSIQDILDHLNLYMQKYTKNTKNSNNINADIYPDLNFNEKKLLKIFQHEIELNYNQIKKISGFDSDILDRTLISLEFKNLIIHKKGKKYIYKGLQNLLKPI